MVIYKVTNLINNKIYIGKTSVPLTERKRRHLYDAERNQHRYGFHAAIRRYGSENFVWEIIDWGLSAESLVTLEKHYIKLFNCRPPHGYNLTEGGEGCSGRIMGAVQRKKMCGEGNPNFGNRWDFRKNLSEETKLKILKSLGANNEM